MAKLSRIVTAAGLALALAGGASAQDKKEAGNPEEIRALLTMADQAATGTAAGSIAIKWEQQHFIKSYEDKTYVPFTVSVDPSAFTAPTPIGMYLRVAKRGEKPPTEEAAAARQDNRKRSKKDEGKGSQVDARHQYPFEDVFFFDLPAPVAGKAPQLSRAFAVVPGDYDVYVAIKEKAAAPSAAAGAPAAPSPKIGVVKHELTVPSLDGDLTTSSVIIAEKIDVLQQEISSERQSENPYTFGAMKLTPSLDQKFVKTQDLNVIFWIYGTGVDGATKKPDVEVEYNFHQKTAEGEKFFNKTEPQVMNAQTLPPQFDLAAGHQLPGSLSVPLSSFPEGEYRLEVKLTDKTSGKTVTRESTFFVAAE